MKIGVIGAGGIGQAFAGHAAKAGYEVILSNSRGPASLDAAAREMGPNARAGTREEAAAADMVFLAVQWPQVPDALASLPAWNGRVLIDATNAVGPAFSALNLNGKSSSEVVASHAPGARVVKAGNTLVRATLAADPHVAGGIVCSSSVATTARPSRPSAKSSAGAVSPPSTSEAWRVAARCSNFQGACCRR